MFKYFCLVLCIVASSFSVHVTDHRSQVTPPTFRERLKPILEACSKEYPSVTTDLVNKATERADSSIIHPCYNGCVFKKAGFINEKGEYDTYNALTNLRQIVPDDEQYASLAEVATECTSVKDTVSDGKAGCERGSMLANCFLQQKGRVLL